MTTDAKTAVEIPEPAMSGPAAALTLQLLEWIAERPHTYAEALDVWRTSCPRLSIWEDASLAGLIDCDMQNGKILSLSPRGRELLGGKQGQAGLPGSGAPFK